MGSETYPRITEPEPKLTLLTAAPDVRLGAYHAVTLSPFQRRPSAACIGIRPIAGNAEGDRQIYRGALNILH